MGSPAGDFGTAAARGIEPVLSSLAGGCPPHVIAKCEDGNSGHHDPDDKCRQEPSAAVSVTERSLSVGVQAWIGLLRLSELSVGRLAIDHSFPLPVVGPTRL
jgi:hypothetical protein